jgi:hypothetical protein
VVRCGLQLSLVSLLRSSGCCQLAAFWAATNGGLVEMSRL